MAKSRSSWIIPALAAVALWGCRDHLDPVAPTPPILSALAGTPTCRGRAATIYPGHPGGGLVIPLDEDAYYIEGTNRADVIIGGTGDDIIDSRAGADRVCSGAGFDLLRGSAGADIIDAGSELDIIIYDASPYAIVIDLARVAQRRGHAQGDSFYGIEGVFGSMYEDTLRGSVNADLLVGNDGEDVFMGRGGADVMIGGEHKDVLDYTGVEAVEVDLVAGTGSGGPAEGDFFSEIESVRGSSQADRILGDDLNNALLGGGGDDLLVGGAGYDSISGGAGRDTIEGGLQLDRLFGDAGNDVLRGGEGNDYLSGGAGSDLLEPGVGTNQVLGGAAHDVATSVSCLDVFRAVEVIDQQDCGVPAARVVVAAVDGSLRMLTLPNRDARVLVASGAGQPEWSPSGDQIVFETSAGLSVTDTLGNVTPLPVPSGSRAPQYSRDGEWIYFHVVTDVDPRIHRIRPSGVDLQDLMEGSHATPSPDPARFALWKAARLWIGDPVTGVGEALGLAVVRGMRWSPDGAWIAKDSDDRIQLLRPNGTLAATFGGAFSGVPAWSPDSRWLLVQLLGQLSLIEVSSGNVVPLPGEGLFSAWKP
jgi:hypothetical protein